MFENWTNLARKVMALAKQQTVSWNHEYIGTEHILLGLMSERDALGSVLVSNLGVDPRKVRLETEKLLKVGPDGTILSLAGQQTPRAKRVIEFATEEMQALKSEKLGTGHLLLGLLREQDGVAAQVLIALGITLEKTRDEVVRLGNEPEDVSLDDVRVFLPVIYQLSARGFPPVRTGKVRVSDILNACLVAATSNDPPRVNDKLVLRYLTLALQDPELAQHAFV